MSVVSSMTTPFAMPTTAALRCAASLSQRWYADGELRGRDSLLGVGEHRPDLLLATTSVGGRTRVSWAPAPGWSDLVAEHLTLPRCDSGTTWDGPAVLEPPLATVLTGEHGTVHLGDTTWSLRRATAVEAARVHDLLTHPPAGRSTAVVSSSYPAGAAHRLVQHLHLGGRWWHVEPVVRDETPHLRLTQADEADAVRRVVRLLALGARP